MLSMIFTMQWTPCMYTQVKQLSQQCIQSYNIKIHVFRPFQFQEKENANSGYKHNNKVSHGIFNLTFRMLQHTSSEVAVTKYVKI